jgi:uncharacterized protein YodC (DUF2158 family)
MPAQLEEGELVESIFGGPAMSLQELRGDCALCMWLDESGTLNEREFPLSVLRRVDEDHQF